jgi:hypothetical protein
MNINWERGFSRLTTLLGSLAWGITWISLFFVLEEIWTFSPPSSGGFRNVLIVGLLLGPALYFFVKLVCYSLARVCSWVFLGFFDKKDQ